MAIPLCNQSGWNTVYACSHWRNRVWKLISRLEGERADTKFKHLFTTRADSILEEGKGKLFIASRKLQRYHLILTF